MMGSFLEVDGEGPNLYLTLYGYGTVAQWDEFLEGKRPPDFPRLCGTLDREGVETLHSALSTFLENTDDEEEDPHPD